MSKSEAKKFSEALAFAAKMHGGQRRKDDSPYIFHPVRVAMYMSAAGLDLRYMIAGLFHDLLEDTEATEEELSVFCDEEMIKAIKLLTKEDGYNEDEYISAILENPLARAVKNADRIDNLNDLKNQDNAAFTRKYLDETERYFVGKFSVELDELWKSIRENS